VRRRKRDTREEQRQALLRQRPNDLPPTVRVRESFVAQGLTINEGAVLSLADPLVRDLIAALGEQTAHRYFELA
jgi:hypothetical protein